MERDGEEAEGDQPTAGGLSVHEREAGSITVPLSAKGHDS
jgi:hypothetical protein